MMNTRPLEVDLDSHAGRADFSGRDMPLIIRGFIGFSFLGMIVM
jgi:hypothetical protein